MNPALLLLADGRFPAGAHAYSAGVEAAVAVGDITDETTLARYLGGRLATTGVTDAAFAAASWSVVDRPRSGPSRPAPCAGDAFEQLDAELDARICSPRLRSVSRRLGRQLLRSGRRAWPHPLLDELVDDGQVGRASAGQGGVHQPIALGALVSVVGGTAVDAALVTMHHLATAVTGAAVRLLGLDPAAVAALHADAGPLIEMLAGDADVWATCDPAELPASGGALTEILGEHHGTWEARLFVA